MLACSMIHANTCSCVRRLPLLLLLLLLLHADATYYGCEWWQASGLGLFLSNLVRASLMDTRTPRPLIRFTLDGDKEDQERQ